jgi:predicted ATPase
VPLFVDEAVHFEPFRDALRPLAEDASSVNLSAQVRAVLGALTGVSTLSDEGPAASAETGQARLFDAVLAGVVSAAQDRPVLLVLEDIHWAERSSLALMAFLDRGLDRHRDARVFMLATCRDGPPEPVAALLGELRRRRAQLLTLAPLSDAAMRSVVAELSPRPVPEAWVARVIDRADGNPFMVEERVTAGESDPATAREVLAIRLTGLGPATSLKTR